MRPEVLGFMHSLSIAELEHGVENSEKNFEKAAKYNGLMKEILAWKQAR